jgi:hypothetical protein
MIGDKYLASIKITIVPEKLKGISVGNLSLFNVTPLSVNIDNIVYTDNLNKIPIEPYSEIELFGDATTIITLFSK